MKTFEQIQREQNILRFAKLRGTYVTVLTLAEQTEQREREQREREQVERRAKQRAERAEREQVELVKYRAERAEREQREREQKAQELVSLGKLSLSVPSYMEDVLDEYWTEYMETANRERDRERREKAIAKRIVQRIMSRAERAEREQVEQAEQAEQTEQAETAKQDSEQAEQAERKRAEIMRAWRAEREQVQKARQSDSDKTEQAERTARQNREREQAERDSIEQAKKDGSLITVIPEPKKPIFPYLKQTAKQTRLRYRERTESDILRNMDSEQAEKLVHTAKIISHQSVKTLYAKNDKISQENVLNMLYIDSAKLLKTDKQAWTRYCEEQAEQSGETTDATETIIHTRQRVNVSADKSLMVECTPWTEQKETEYNKQATIGYNETAYTAEDIMQTVLLRMIELFQIGQFTTNSDIWTAIRQRKLTAETEQQAEQKETAKKLVNLIYSSANTFIKGQKTRAEREQKESATDSDSEQDSNTRVYEIDAQDGRQTDGYTLNNYKALNDSIIHSGLTEIVKKLYARVKSPETCARVIIMHGDKQSNTDIARALSLDEKQVRRFITYGERIANSKEALNLVYELTIAL